MYFQSWETFPIWNCSLQFRAPLQSLRNCQSRQLFAIAVFFANGNRLPAGKNRAFWQMARARGCTALPENPGSGGESRRDSSGVGTGDRSRDRGRRQSGLAAPVRQAIESEPDCRSLSDFSEKAVLTGLWITFPPPAVAVFYRHDHCRPPCFTPIRWTLSSC